MTRRYTITMQQKGTGMISKIYYDAEGHADARAYFENNFDRFNDLVGIRVDVRHLNADEIRDIAVELGADRRRLYGTSRQVLVLKLRELEDQQV